MRTRVLVLVLALFLVAGSGRLQAQSPRPAGGANQRPSVEGCIGDTLFNGIWRLKVLSSKLDTNPEDAESKNWAVAIELRNGKNAQNSPGDSGFEEYPQLAFGDESIDMETVGAKVQYQKAIYYKSLPPGGVARTTLWYRLDATMPKRRPPSSW